MIGHRIIGEKLSVTTSDTSKFVAIKYFNGHCGVVTLDIIMTMPVSEYAKNEPGIADAINARISSEQSLEPLETFRAQDYGRDIYISARLAQPLIDAFTAYQDARKAATAPVQV